MVENTQTNSYAFDQNEKDLLWKKLIKRFIFNKPTLAIEEDINPNKVWQNADFRAAFLLDFTSKTNYSVSQILKDNTTNGQKNISITYLQNHFGGDENSFQDGYLNRFVYYITDGKIKYWNPYLFSNGFSLKNVEVGKASTAESKTENMANINPALGPGAHNLIGNWISFNGNADDGSLALCYYKFYKSGNKILIEREGYKAERIFKGEVFVQDDSSYLFDLQGENRGRRKFIIAHDQKINPAILFCYSSAIADGHPIFAKEILIKLADTANPNIDGGEIVNPETFDLRLKHFFKEPELNVIKNEVALFLGENEVPFFHLHDLKKIKKKHLVHIDNELNTEIFKKKSSGYIHFNKLGKNIVPTKRNVIKYEKNETKFIGKEKEIEVKDEYTYLQVCQYNSSKVHKHTNSFKANQENGFVDLQALFPIGKAELAIDMGSPIWHISNLEMDAATDSFSSSATFLNDFSNCKKISFDYEVKTLESEIIIDFSSIEEFSSLNIRIEKLIYSYNIIDGQKRKIINLIPQNLNIKGITLKNIDKKLSKIETDETLDIDPANPKIFAIKIDFVSEPGEYLYVHFNVDL